MKILLYDRLTFIYSYEGIAFTTSKGMNFVLSASETLLGVKYHNTHPSRDSRM